MKNMFTKIKTVRVPRWVEKLAREMPPDCDVYYRPHVRAIRITYRGKSISDVTYDIARKLPKDHFKIWVETIVNVRKTQPENKSEYTPSLDILIPVCIGKMGKDDE